MKIWIHTMYYLPEFGSASILMDELASFLAERGHKVEVLSTIPRPPHNKSYGWRLCHSEKKNNYFIRRYRTNFTVHHIGRLIAWSIYTFWTIVNLVRVEKKDVLLLRFPPLQLGITGALARKLKKARVVFSVQDIHPDLSIESGLLRNSQAIRLALAFERWNYSQADEIVVISEGFKRNLEAKGVPGSRLSIIPNWVDIEYLKPLSKDNPVSRKFGFHDKFVVMYAGTITLSSYQSLARVFEAASKLKDINNIKIVIVGDGLKKPELQKKSRNLGLKNVIFLPFQPYEDLPYLLASSDLLMVPLDQEKKQLSVPSKLYNYMAAGKAILGLADSESEVALILEKSGGGITVNPDDVEGVVKVIRQLNKDFSSRETMGKKAREYVEKYYAKEAVLEKYEKVLLNKQLIT